MPATTSSTSGISPYLSVYPRDSEALPLRKRTTLSTIARQSGPLTLTIETAPVPTEVAGAQTVSEKFMFTAANLLKHRLKSSYIFSIFALRKFTV